MKKNNKRALKKKPVVSTAEDEWQKRFEEFCKRLDELIKGKGK